MRVRYALIVVLIFAFDVSAATYVVTRSDDRNGTCVSDSDCSLREAVKAANATAADDTILFRAGITTITLDNVEIAINNNGKLTINGNGADLLTIDGGPGQNRIFYVAGAAVTLRSMTLTGGNAVGTVALFNLQGGAMYVNGGSVTLDRMNITGNNTTSGLAGAIFYFAGFGTPANRILNSTFSNNQSGTSCGAFYNGGGSNLTVVNSTFAGNLAQTGGAICNDGDLDLRSATIAGNTGAQGGGGFYQGAGQSTLANTIVAGNVGPAASPEILSNGTVTSLGNNLVGDSPGDSGSTGNPIAFQPTDVRDVSPLLGPLAQNGGQTPTRALTAGSPAINAGSNALAVDPSNGNASISHDQRDFARIAGGTIDIGANESGSSNLAPVVGGRVTIRDRVTARVFVTLTSLGGAEFVTPTNHFGYFRFVLPQAGRNYLLSVRSKQTSFQPRWIYVSDDPGALNITDF